MIDSTHIKKRYDIPLMISPNAITIELGVAEGSFSEAILQKGNVQYHYAVDRYSGERNHTDEQYILAQKKLDQYREKCTLIRADFNSALNLFEDNYFDFIYIDGYAHTGQENGKTLEDWWPKVRHGGIFGGDDYSTKWKPTMNAVNQFVKKYNLELFIINCEPEEDWASLSPSWFVIK